MPESIPAPGGREHRADGSEAAKRLCSFFGEDQAELLDIHREDIPAVTDTRRNGMRKCSTKSWSRQRILRNITTNYKGGERRE